MMDRSSLKNTGIPTPFQVEPFHNAKVVISYHKAFLPFIWFQWKPHGWLRTLRHLWRICKTPSLSPNALQYRDDPLKSKQTDWFGHSTGRKSIWATYSLQQWMDAPWPREWVCASTTWTSTSLQNVPRITWGLLPVLLHIKWQVVSYATEHEV